MIKIILTITLLLTTAAPFVAQKADDWTKMSDQKRSQAKSNKHKEKIETTYDKFKDLTFVELQDMRVGDGVYLALITTARGLGMPSTEGSVYMAFTLYNATWHCLDGCQVTFLVNGRRVDLGVAENLSRKVSQGSVYCNRWGCDKPTISVIERIGVSVPYETFSKIAFATSVEFQAGTDEAVLSDNHLAAIRDFASRFVTPVH
jgi:hypothetical protein